jgi:pimeloyl-ACP methyl ester carboxylesterase
MRCQVPAAKLLIASILIVGSAEAGAQQSTEFIPSHSLCRVGAYASTKGEALALTIAAKDQPVPVGFYYQFVDGRSGNTTDESSLVFCGDRAVYVKQADGTVETWAQVPLRWTRTRFKSQGYTLSGMLVEPTRQKGAKPPLVVLAHGSGRRSAVNHNANPYLFASQGISTFVFDKHGTGESAGTFHINFRRLAADVAAASAEAKRLAAGRYGRFGLYGGSQGGWVAPLAAKDAGADFVAIGFGGVFSPAEEDALEVEIALREQGFGDDVLTKARNITAATSTLLTSNYTRGHEELARWKKEYAQEPWLAKITNGRISGMLKSSEAGLRERAGRPPSLEMDFAYDGVETLRNLTMPVLWTVAEKDREAPPEITRERLAMLQRDGKKNITVVVFPNTDHGMEEFEQRADGSRRSTRVTDGFFRLLADWMKGSLSPPYGRAEFQPAGAVSK